MIYTVEETAKLLKMGRKNITKLIELGKLQGIDSTPWSRNRSYRISQGAIDAFMAAPQDTTQTIIDVAPTRKRMSSVKTGKMNSGRAGSDFMADFKNWKGANGKG